MDLTRRDVVAPVVGEHDVERVQIDLPAELYQRACQLAESEGWPAAETLLTVIAHGVAYLNGEQEVRRLRQGDPELRAEVERFHAKAMQLDGAYSVMKFRAYELTKLVRTLEMNNTGLQGENDLAKRRIAIFREDEARLRAEITSLQTRLAELDRNAADAGATGSERDGTPASHSGVGSWLHPVARNRSGTQGRPDTR
jgi:hypothetical protein